MMNSVFYNPTGKRNPEESNLENYGPREWVPFFLSNNQETLSPERHGHDERSEVVHHLTGKLLSQGCNTKQCSPP
jgi:hypothetical protein